MGVIGENILKTFFYNYLIINDINQVDKMLSINFKGVGTSQFELAFSKNEMLESMKTQIDNLKGKVSFYLTNYIEDYFNNIISSYCNVNIIYFDKEEKKMITRLTTIFFKEDNEWKIVNMHNSLPEISQTKKDIFPINYNLSYDKKDEIELYLPCKYKKAIFKPNEIDYIIYSSFERKTIFYLNNLDKFEIKRNFSEVEIKLININFFYKIDRGTLINLKNIEILDFKEEKIIFKNKSFLYISKSKLKEVEIKWIELKSSLKIEI